jgi:3-oxoisoapionate decarboxylase
MEWAVKQGAEGVQFSGLESPQREKADKAYLKDMAQFAEEKGLYLEWGGGQHIPFDLSSWQRIDLGEINRKAAEEASVIGTRIIRSCSGGLMRWDPASPMTETLIQESAASLLSQKQMLIDYNVILAVETHFEFTTWELIRLFERCNTEPGEYLGICLDTMNLLTMLEDPVNASERILPWVVSTHIKDGAIIFTEDGMMTFPVEIGKGVVDIKKISDLLKLLPWTVNLSIEDHGGDVSRPVYDPLFVSKFPDLSIQEFAGLLKLASLSVTALQKGTINMVSRDKWPEICEKRYIKDLDNLKSILRKGT